jgi:hypothetical protein
MIEALPRRYRGCDRHRRDVNGIYGREFQCIRFARPHGGAVIAFTPHTTNGATVTLNVDALGPKPLRSSPNAELIAGTIIQGTPYLAVYNNTDGAFYLQGFFGNPYNIPLAGGLPFFGGVAPNSSFVFPFGQAISRTTYSALFGILGDLRRRRRLDYVQHSRPSRARSCRQG